MPHTQLCQPCHEAIMGAANGDTLCLCPACRFKGEDVSYVITCRAAVTGRMVHLNFDPPVGEAEERDELPGTAAPDPQQETPTDNVMSVDPDQMAMFPDIPGADLQMVLIEDIDRANNHRHLATIDPFKLREMANSIEKAGLMQPIRVYERYPEDQREGIPRYIMGFGYRRCAAHELLDSGHIMAQVCPPAPAADIQQARALENLARQDLNTLEEMTAVVMLLAACDGDIDVVAGMLGRPRKWVKDRLYLDRLSKSLQEQVAAGEINLAHARELAKLVDHRAQEVIARWWSHRNLHTGTPDNSFKTDVDRRMRTLRGTPWKLDQPFADKQACSSCPHNSANDLELFERDPAEKASATCASADCYAHKTKAAETQLAKAIKAVAGDVVDGKLSMTMARSKAPEGIRPEAIIAEVRREASPAKHAAGASSSKRETDEQKRQRLARRKFDKATAEWHQARNQEIREAMNTTPQRRLVLELFDHCPTLEGKLHTWSKTKGRLDKPADQLFASLIKFDDDAILAIGKDLQSDTDFYHGMDQLASPIRDRLFKALSIPDETPEPKLKDFLPPEAAPKPVKPAAVKKTKEAKASKTPKSNTPSKINHKGKAAAAGDYLDDVEGGDV